MNKHKITQQKVFGRLPSVPNKYHLTAKSLTHLSIKDETKLAEPRFWRNDVINAWCATITLPENWKEYQFWIGIYDEPYRKKRVHTSFTYHSGMMDYKFKHFYDPKEIKNENELRIQEQALKLINELLDENILQLNA